MPAQGLMADPWPSIEPGALKHQITIQQQSSMQDEAGQPVPIWGAIRTCWGGINLVSMREAFGGNQLTAQSTDIWTVRWSSTQILPGMQLIFGNGLYRIMAVSNPGQRNILLHFLCLEINAGSGS